MRTISCGTTRPAPRFRWPTSLFPICPSGRPTARPDASSSVFGARSHSRCHVGVAPSSTALPSRPGRNPQPSSTMSATGVRDPSLSFILKGMQSTDALRLLPVVVLLAAPLTAQTRVRVSSDGAWFYQEAEGRRLAQLEAGAVLQQDSAQGQWVRVILDGWIFGSSVGSTDRSGFDLAVTKAPTENLRAAPAGAVVAHLSKGFLLDKLAEQSGWVHVKRQGWMQRTTLAAVGSPPPLPSPDANAGQGGSTPALRPVDSDTTPPAAVDPGRVQS